MNRTRLCAAPQSFPRRLSAERSPIPYRFPSEIARELCPSGTLGPISVSCGNRPRRPYVGGAVVLLQNRRTYPTPPPVLHRWSDGWKPGYFTAIPGLSSFPEGPTGLPREKQPSLHRREVGGGAGTRRGVAGAESRPHRHKVGGGRNSSPCKKLRCARTLLRE